MIRFQALGTAFRLPLLTCIMPLLAMRLGLPGGFGAVALALCIHELAHIICAKFCGVQITEICLMPFGGSARMENPYQLPARAILPVAAAGPTANLAGAICCAALAHWEILSSTAAIAFIRPSLILCLFNLFPALPLDGGRILFVLLVPRLGERRALNTGLLLGRILALLLLFLAIRSRVRQGCWNITFVLAAIFIIASEHDERAALAGALAARLEDQLHTPAVPRLTRFYQIDARTSVHSAMQLLRPRERTIFVLMEQGIPTAMLDGGSIVAHVLKGGAPDSALRDLPAGISLPTASGAAKIVLFN